jgi:NAD(P)-dependent dehydrogenase (short-subunit alcohol dehydrogenase family)
MKLAGRTALITGGSTGIGRATAIRFAGEGAAVVIADVNEEDGRSAVAELESRAGRALFIRCDVRREDEVAEAVAEAREWGAGLHLLISAAGILQGAYRSVEELDLATFERVLDVNVLGTFLVCKYGAPAIEASGGGVILCLASGAGVSGPSSSLAYGSSKGGVNGFCMTLARDLGPRGIRVNVICPGSLDTPMKRQNVMDGAVAAGRDPHETLAGTQLGDPDGVAKVLAFLASEDADYVRGVIFTR